MAVSSSDQDIPQCQTSGTIANWRKCWRWTAGAVCAFALTLPTFFYLRPILDKLFAMSTASFWVAGAALGAVLAVGPLACVICVLAALFVRVRIGFADGYRPVDLSAWFFTLIAMLITFSPALAALYIPVKAVATGYIAFRGEGQQYPRAADPYGFWQAVGFWTMGAAALAFLAGRYWRSRFTAPTPKSD